MRIAIEALTDVGLVRELNEDSYRVIPERQAIVVCDGMGGHAAGEVASATAADTIADWLKNGSLAVAGPLVPSLGADWPPEAVQLAAAVRLANRRLYNEAARSHKLRGMGTTVAAVLFRPGSVITAHVGDSRVYRITPQRIEQLTTDHSWVAELLESGHVRPEDVQHFADKNVITRALGTRPGVQVDLGIHAAAGGDARGRRLDRSVGRLAGSGRPRQGRGDEKAPGGPAQHRLEVYPVSCRSARPPAG